MKLLSISVSLPKEVIYKERKISTSIFKEPIKGDVFVRSSNIEGDRQADLKVHGGIHKAVMVYSHDNYKYWESKLNRDDFKMGQFGENFTVNEMQETDVCIGDQFKIGDCVFEVTQPRIPCFKLEIKMQEENFIDKYLKSDHTGFYFKVIKEGNVKAGDIIEKIYEDPSKVSIAMIKNALYFDKLTKEIILKILNLDALSPSWKVKFERKLKNL